MCQTYHHDLVLRMCLFANGFNTNNKVEEGLQHVFVLERSNLTGKIALYLVDL